MTKEERQLMSQQKELAYLQKKASMDVFKQEAKFKAVEAAQSLNTDRYLSLERKNKSTPFDIVKESERIYQWLLKGL